MSFLNSVLKVFVGDKSKQDVKKITPIVKSITSLDENVSILTNDELRNKTKDFKSLINKSTKTLNEQIDKLESSESSQITILGQSFGHRNKMTLEH